MIRLDAFITNAVGHSGVDGSCHDPELEDSFHVLMTDKS